MSSHPDSKPITTFTSIKPSSQIPIRKLHRIQIHIEPGQTLPDRKPPTPRQIPCIQTERRPGRTAGELLCCAFFQSDVCDQRVVDAITVEEELEAAVVGVDGVADAA